MIKKQKLWHTCLGALLLTSTLAAQASGILWTDERYPWGQESEPSLPSFDTEHRSHPEDRPAKEPDIDDESVSPPAPILNKINKTIKQAISYPTSCINAELDTQNSESFEFKNHHQSMIITKTKSNGDKNVFVSHSETPYGKMLSFSIDANSSTGRITSNAKGEEQSRIGIDSETHPSALAYYPLPNDEGIILMASEDKKQIISIGSYSSGQFKNKIYKKGMPSGSVVAKDGLTDIFLAETNFYTYMIAWSMNAGEGHAYIADRSDLDDVDHSNFLYKFKYLNTFSAPQRDTGCGKSLGQNAIIVEDSNHKWYVVHSYDDGVHSKTGVKQCGLNMGATKVKAWEINLTPEGVSMPAASSPVATMTIAEDPKKDGTHFPGGDGASGFYINKDKELIVALGAQFADLMGFDYKTRIKTCKAGS